MVDDATKVVEEALLEVIARTAASTLDVPRSYGLLLDALRPLLPAIAAARRGAIFDLAAALAPTGDRAADAGLRARLATPARWPPLVSLAEEHLLLPALWAGLRRHAAVDAVPAPLRRHLAERVGDGSVVPVELALEDLHDANAERNRALRAQAIEVVQLLRQVGIEPVLLKGAAWLVAGGRDPGERVLRDLDLLVSEGSVDGAVEALRVAGYLPIGPDGDATVARSIAWYRERYHHYCPLVRAGSPAPVELHWALGTGAVDVALPAARVRRDAVVAGSEPSPMLTPSLRDHVLLLLLHAQVSDFGQRRAALPLRALHDLALVLRQHEEEIPWDGVGAELAAAGLAATGARFLAGAERLLGIHPSLPPAIAPDPAARRHVERCIANASLPPALRRGALELRGAWLRAVRRGA